MKNDITVEMLRSLNAELEVLSTANKPSLSSKNHAAPPPQLRHLTSKQQVPETPAEVEKLKSALSVLSPDALRGQGILYEPGDLGATSNYWLMVVWAVASLNWISGKEIVRKWSMGSTRFTNEGFESAWNAYDHSRPNAIGIGSLYRLAIDNGWQPLFTAPADALLMADASRYKVLSPVAIQALPHQQWRVKHVLPTSGLAALFGPSGSGKSFLALDLASCISHGVPWFGIRVNQAPVLYVMLEGEGGIRNRIAAHENAQGPLPANAFGVITQPFQLTTPQDVIDLAVATPPGAVIFIDTLNRAAPTSDENSSKEMGVILQAAKDLQLRTQGLVIVVHHTGKDSSKGMRGHSSLHAALDAAIEVERTATGSRHWSIAKAKDGEDGKKVAFKLKVHTLGQDADGDDITSCSVEPDLASIFVKAEPKGSKQRGALKVAKNLFTSSQASTGVACCPVGAKCMKVEVVVVALASTLATTAANKRNNEARRLVRALISSGHLGSAIDASGDAWCWLG